MAAAHGDEAPIRVFVADDHDVVRRALGDYLADVGFVVIGEARDVGELLAAEALGRADALVLDLSLPPRGGLASLACVRASHPAIVIVVVSMAPADPYAAHARLAGAADFVSKEAPPPALADALRRAVAAR